MSARSRPRRTAFTGARRLLALVAALMLVAAACNDDGDGDASPPPASPSSSTSSTTAAATGGPVSECLSEEEIAGRAIERQEGEAVGGPLFIADVSIVLDSTHCEDMVVFAFENVEDGEVGYVVEPAEPPFLDIPGNEVAVEGESYVRIVLFNGTSVDLSGDEPRETYTGPTRFRPDDTQVLVELVEISDFEGVAEWVVGLRDAQPFTVHAGGEVLSVSFDYADPYAS